MEAIATDVAANAITSLISRTWQEIQCMLNYNTNIKKLEMKVKELDVKKDAVKLLVDAAKNNAEVVGPDVVHWLEEVDNIKKEVDGVLASTRNTQWGCLYCKCPKLHSRHKLSKEALGWTTGVTELQNGSKFERIGYPAPPGQMPFTSPQELDGFKSRMKSTNDIMEALKDDSITTIGICGMAGVGKTTLVEQIADKVRSKKLFDEVVMAVVSKDPVISNIQDQLAESLGLKFEEKTDHARAGRLYTRLMDKEKRILVILDDLWQELDVRKIGIPVVGERQGFKVLLTSRYRGVCGDMRARTIEVKVLSEEESWHLFKETSEIHEEASDLKDIAQEVSKECGGLPLAIVIVGKALKNKKVDVWRDALQQLKESSVTSIRGIHNLVYSRIKLSYEYLENDESKELLLLCSLYPEDSNIPLEDLVRYAKGLLLKNVASMARTRERVSSITDELKSCYLLLEGDNECVKLHDAVRDFCLSVASSEGEHMHMVRHSGLKEWPQKDSYASYTAISLTFDEIEELCSGLKCPKLKLLQLIFQKHNLHIPEDFFKGMEELRTLKLFNLNGELPSTLQALVNLQMLSLDNCRLYGDISIIGCQKKLEILSFYNSSLEKFPDKIAELSNLKSLDLRFKEGPPLPSGILVSLKKLEELYLGSFQEWESRGEEAYSVIIKEIGSLQHLQSLQYCTYDDYCLRKVLQNLHLEKLMRFKITRTPVDKGVGEFQFTKALSLQCVNVDVLLSPSVHALLKRTENLTLTVEGLTNVMNELDGNGLVNLKTLQLHSCDLKYLIDATDSLTSGGAFINLEKLVIGEANNLEKLWHGNLPLGSFARLREMQLYDLPALTHMWGVIHQPCLGNLRILRIKNCSSLRTLFLKSSLKCFLQLQEIKIEKCPKLERVVSDDEEDATDAELPKLGILVLSDVESLRSLGAESGHAYLFKKVMLPDLERLDIWDVNGIRCIVDAQMSIGSLSKLQSIYIARCVGLVHVAASDSIKLLQNLEKLDIISCESLEVVFDFTGLNFHGADIERGILGRLEILELHDLSNLKNIWRMLPEGIHAFQNLKYLRLVSCNLKYLLSPSMAKMLVSLETLIISFSPEIETIIGSDESMIPETESEEDTVKKKDGNEKINKIEFPKLRYLRVSLLENFRMLCAENIDLELPSLTTLVVQDCPRMTKLCVGQFSAPSIDHVGLDHLGMVNITLDVFNSCLKDYESGIRCFDCSRWNFKNCSCTEIKVRVQQLCEESKGKPVEAIGS